MSQEIKRDRAERAISMVHKDRSVSLEAVLDSLEYLKDYVSTLMAAISEDINERKARKE
jgi:hypothetical protein